MHATALLGLSPSANVFNLMVKYIGARSATVFNLKVKYESPSRQRI